MSSIFDNYCSFMNSTYSIYIEASTSDIRDETLFTVEVTKGDVWTVENVLSEFSSKLKDACSSDVVKDKSIILGIFHNLNGGASTVLPVNITDELIEEVTRNLSIFLSNPTVPKHQYLLPDRLFVGKEVSENILCYDNNEDAVLSDCHNTFKDIFEFFRKTDAYASIDFAYDKYCDNQNSIDYSHHIFVGDLEFEFTARISEFSFNYLQTFGCPPVHREKTRGYSKQLLYPLTPNNINIDWRNHISMAYAFDGYHSNVIYNIMLSHDCDKFYINTKDNIITGDELKNLLLSNKSQGSNIFGSAISKMMA